MNALGDPLLYVFVVYRVVLTLLYRSPLWDGFDTEDNGLPLQWESVYGFMVAIPDVYFIQWIAVFLVGPGGTPIQAVNLVVWTITVGVLVALRLAIPFAKTISFENSAKSVMFKSLLFPAAILIGVGATTFITVVAHPNPETIDFLYQYHLNIAMVRLDQLQVGLDLDRKIIPSVLTNLVQGFSLMFEIYLNNAHLAVLSGAVGVVSGIVKIPLFFIYAVNAAVHWGVLTGLLVRNAIAAGAGVTAPAIGLIGTIGFFFLSHTIHELTAIVGVGMFTSYVGRGAWRWFWKKPGARMMAVKGLVYAVVFELGAQLGFAALFEVGLDPFVTSWAIGYITTPATVAPYSGYPLLPVFVSIGSVFVLGLFWIAVIQGYVYVVQPVAQEVETYV